MLYSLDAKDRGQLIIAMDPLGLADIADLLEQIHPFDRNHMIRLYDCEIGSQSLTALQKGLREEIIGLLKPDVFADAVRNLETDDVVDSPEDLDNNQQEAILEVLADADRVAVESSLNYPEHSAGRLMQRELVIAPEDYLVGNAIDHLRATDNTPQQFYHVTLVAGKMHQLANVSLGLLMATRRNVARRDIAEEILQAIPVAKAEADVAYAFNQYYLISTLVVDEHGRIIGVITIDYGMVVLGEEHDEDILRLAGFEIGSLSDPVLQTTWQRFPWLAGNLVTAILTSNFTAQFKATIESLVALAVLLPFILSTVGNAGTHSLDVAVRAIANKDLTASHVWCVVRWEVFVGLNNGVLIAVLMGTVGLILFNSPTLGYAIALAVAINFMTAGLRGTGIPVTLQRFSIDPALASSAFLTTVTDVVGFLAFLGLAVWVLF